MAWEECVCGLTTQRSLAFAQDDLLLTDSRIVADVLRVLSGEAPQHCKAAAEVSSDGRTDPAAFREVSVWGDRCIQVVDAQGNYSGVGADGVIRKELADVTFLQSDGAVIVTLPPTTPYSARITQTGDRPMQVTVANFGPAEDGTFVPQATFDHVPSGTGGLVILPNTGAPIAELTLVHDANADGAPEGMLQPDAVLREGTNGWTCFTDWPACPANDP